MTAVLTTEGRIFAEAMAAEQLRDLRVAMLTVQSRAAGFAEFAAEAGGIDLSGDNLGQMVKTVDALHDLYNGGLR